LINISLDQRLETERLEREKVEQAKQQALLTLVSQTINENMVQHMEIVVHQEMQNFIVPFLGKTLIQALENSLLKPLQENLKKTIMQNVIPRLEESIRGSMRMDISEISRGIDGAIREAIGIPIQQGFHTQFTETLGID